MSLCAKMLVILPTVAVSIVGKGKWCFNITMKIVLTLKSPWKSPRTSRAHWPHFENLAGCWYLWSFCYLLWFFFFFFPFWENPEAWLFSSLIWSSFLFNYFITFLGRKIEFLRTLALHFHRSWFLFFGCIFGPHISSWISEIYITFTLTSVCSVKNIGSLFLCLVCPSCFWFFLKC